jgi:hypothetical protein
VAAAVAPDNSGKRYDGSMIAAPDHLIQRLI